MKKPKRDLIRVACVWLASTKCILSLQVNMDVNLNAASSDRSPLLTSAGLSFSLSQDKH